MGVAGEAGEVVEKWKKIVAYKEGRISEEDLNELAKELGDVVWYIAVLAHSLGLSFEDVMQQNLESLPVASSAIPSKVKVTTANYSITSDYSTKAISADSL